MPRPEIELVRPLRWQDGKPTEPGWYWARFAAWPGTSYIIEIYRAEGQLWITRHPAFGGMMSLDSDSQIVQFAGPIPEPL